MSTRNEILKKQSELIEVLKRDVTSYSSIPGVHHIDVGLKYIDGIKTNEISIRFHTYKKNSKSFLKSLTVPKMISGVRTDVIVSNPILNSRKGKVALQILGGVEIANAHMMEFGTLGCVLLHQSGKHVGLTNHHVIVGSMGGKGEEIIQPYSPTSSKSQVIGEILEFNKDLDCAIFTLNSQRKANIYSIEGFNQLFTESSQPVIHDRVKKSGITTEITYGEIEGISLNGRLTISCIPQRPNPGTKISDQGDSGSLWVIDSETKGVAMGLHYAGESNFSKAYAYDINLIFKALNINTKTP
ncbi:hypothetical protein [Pedobacter gandavensis]|uniref:hypothetical protein n=1 Tax=Pedobacter gandavensis TaxID=2679963 RepID=UPI0029300E35|nr:hypothetical protein [Pedobacter gandavensis]